MTLEQISKDVDLFVACELSMTTQDLYLIAGNIRRAIEDTNIPLETASEARNELSDIYEELQATGTNLETLQSRLELVLKQILPGPQEPAEIAELQGNFCEYCSSLLDCIICHKRAA